MELHIALILILLYASAWISSSETALFSLSSHKVKTYEESSDPKKQLIAHLLAHPRDLLVTVFMINTCVNIFLQNVFSDLFGTYAGFGLKVGVPLVLTLIFGEIIPKYIGLQNNATVAYKVIPTLDRLNNALKWVRKVTISITVPISRALFFFLKKEPEISTEEIEHILKTSTDLGILDRKEAELLEGCLRLQERPIKELMWPKEDIIYYDLSQNISQLIHLFIDQELTRVPVCSGALENVLGIITSMQFFQHQEQIKNSNDLLPYLDKPFYVPETTPAKLLLKQMDEASHVLALIVDEYGNVMGLISREDLIEVVVGAIDMAKNPPLFAPVSPREVFSSGKWELSEFNDYFNASLKSENYVTVGGWLTEQIGDIPKAGMKLKLEGFLFHVLTASPTRIIRLSIKRL